MLVPAVVFAYNPIFSLHMPLLDRATLFEDVHLQILFMRCGDWIIDYSELELAVN